ncbi:MAG: ABC transporter permease, partial [Alphaproteobacteria bacterium]|nr:ABC transporter permease [Alphaproteobacteria bacterium]
MSAVTLRKPRAPSTLMLGSFFLTAIVIACLIGIWFTPYDPTAFAVRFRLQPPTALHPFGTDEFGRDVLSRVLAGGHLSLATGFGAMAISLL